MGALRATGSADLEAIRMYYQQSWLDYRHLWFDASSCALHFGYWDEATRSHAESLANTNRIVAAHAGIRAGQRVLDAGCGIAGTAMWLAERHDVHVTGITISADQVRRARRRIDGRGLSDRIRVECRDMTDTGFPAETFDVVYAIESAGYTADKARFLREVSRVLRPGGRLVVADGFRVARPLSRDGERLLGSWLADWAIPDLVTLEEAAKGALAAGFAHADHVDVTERMQRSLRRLYRLATVLGPFESILWALRIRSTVQHRNVLGARKQWLAMAGGLWRYAIFTARKA